MKFKSSVELNGLKGPMLHALSVVEYVYNDIAGLEPTCTSALDSHTRLLHPQGLAVDIRVKDVPLERWISLEKALKAALNPFFGITLYDVILETNRPGHEHIHIEYQPKLIISEG